jgi:aspartyl-tRNA(Asn)/glutamyl-tRNA(Gln) amidotransferase subunit B
MSFEAVIGLEVHAELETRSKMFCSCPVVDVTQAQPNTAVCPICAGMPGVLPVVNRRAVEYALRVALALGCQVAQTSIFARKNYFYPDLPKGYQISQYEAPLARSGSLLIQTSQGERAIRIRRVHLEEDTGKLTHVYGTDGAPAYTLVDLNRAGIPLLEIVTEPDFHSAEEVRAYAVSLRSLLRYLGVNSGDMQKGVLRIEPNISIRPAGSQQLGTRVEVKNLNSFRALERAVDFEIRRQSDLRRREQTIQQETVGWDEAQGATFTQRVKEGEDDYRYFPEPDLPPLVIDQSWLEQLRSELPELPHARLTRFSAQYSLSSYDAGVLTAEKSVADYFEAAVKAAPDVSPKMLANWITGDLFSLVNQAGAEFESLSLSPPSFAELVALVSRGEISKASGRAVLAEMFTKGRTAAHIVREQNLQQISAPETIRLLVADVLAAHPEQVREYLAGKESVLRWFFGQVMRAAQGQANPRVVEAELTFQLSQTKDEPDLTNQD